jgi:TetR/AcrR family transcriptional regulator, mexJK operon transcriptional repressor
MQEALSNGFPSLLADLDLPRLPKQARSRQKREAILATAAHLFAERGYEATTADEIAAAAGVSVGTFYGYFRNKRQVFLTLFNASFESFLALGITEIELGPNPRQIIRETVRQAMQRDDMYFGLRRAWHELKPRDPEIATYHDQLQRLIYQQVVLAVQKVVDQGYAWPDLDVAATCWIITTLLDRAWETAPGPAEASEAEIERQQNALADLIYHTIFRSEE